MKIDLRAQVWAGPFLTCWRCAQYRTREIEEEGTTSMKKSQPRESLSPSARYGIGNNGHNSAANTS
jgi:hypothetical protein